MPIRDAINRVMDVKSLIGGVVGVIMTLSVGYTYIETQLETWSEKFTDKFYQSFTERVKQDDEVYEHFTKLSYDITKFGLMKQLEKLSNDPEDIKDMDLLFYAGVCDKNIYFNIEYIPNSEYSRGLRIACSKILELNDQRYGK